MMRGQFKTNPDRVIGVPQPGFSPPFRRYRKGRDVIMTHTITLFDLITETDLTTAIEAKLINVREDGAGLRILNYSDAAMYTPGAWESPAVRQCRGVIVDSEWRIIARPWSKFFNHGQVEAGELDLSAPVEVTDKMDGSLGIIHRALDGSQRVASRGSFESDQAIHATTVLRERYADLTNLHVITPLAEIVYPQNRIVVDYGNLDDLILLGGVNIESGTYYGPEVTAAVIGWIGPLAKVFEYDTLRDALAADQRPGMEGLCVRRLDQNHIVKIKQEEYVRLHKIVTGLSERSVWEHMSEGKPLNDMLAELPDELHEWTRDVWTGLRDSATKIATTARLTHIEIVNRLGETCSRKDYAQAAMDHPDVRPYLFNLLDGRDPHPSILKTLKPVGQTHARVISEAVA